MSGKVLKTLDEIYSVKFLVLLTTPWSKTKAYKLGIIDQNGNKLKDPSSLEEQKSYTTFHKLVFNIKKLIEKIPFGKNNISKYATALYMLKEETSLDLTKEFLSFVNIYSTESLIEENSKYIKMFGYSFIKDGNQLILEDSCSTGGIEFIDKPLFNKKYFKRQNKRKIR